MHSNSHHSGAVLIITMALLLMLALLATSSLSQSQIAGHLLRHYQQSKVTHRAAKNTINYLLSDSRYFIEYADNWDSQGRLSATMPEYLSPHKISVAVSQATCLLEIQRNNCAGDPEPCLATYYWELTAEAKDSRSAASTTVIQGFRFDYLPGYCPNPLFCQGADCDSEQTGNSEALFVAQTTPTHQTESGVVTRLWQYSD